MRRPEGAGRHCSIWQRPSIAAAAFTGKSFRCGPQAVANPHNVLMFTEEVAMIPTCLGVQGDRGCMVSQNPRAQSGVSESRLPLANCLWEVTSPQRILVISSLGARERLQRLLERYRTRFVSLGLLESLRAVASSPSPFARFMLVHSPFEFLLDQLDNDPQQEREDHGYLEERVKLLCIAPFLLSKAPLPMTVRKRFLPKPVPINYTNLILDLRHYPREQFFVTSSNSKDTIQLSSDSSLQDFTLDESFCLLRFSGAHAPFLCTPMNYWVYSSNNISAPTEILTEDSATYEIQHRGDLFEEIVGIVEAAQAFIQAYQPPLMQELRFFVRAFVMDTSLEGKGKKAYSSIPWQPGLVQLAPYRLGTPEGITVLKKGDPLLAMLVAAQIIHEGVHQKHYYLTRCEDTEPVNDGQYGFIRPEFSEVQMTCPWGEEKTRCLHRFFSLAVSVGFEIMFLEHLLRSQRFSSERQEFLKRRLKRKRGYLFPFLVQAELLQHCFSPEGELVLEELFRLFGYQRT